MFERMLDKGNEPDQLEIREHIGEASYAKLRAFEDQLAQQYELTRELRFPFGNNYEWGYKYGNKTSHLCYAFFEKGAFTITLQIGDKRVAVVERIMESLTPKARELWSNRYPCGDIGGWIHYRVLDDIDMSDTILLVNVKRAPKGK